MIRGHSQSETPHKLVELYNRMVEAEAEPNEFTYSFLIGGCARSKLLREGEQVHGRVVANGYCTNVFVRTSLVNLYAIAGGYDGVRKARRVFDEIVDRNIVSWNSLLAGYVRCGDVDGARRIFDEMPERNVVSWTTMIAGCAQIGRFGTWIHSYIDERLHAGNQPLLVSLNNSLIHMYASCGVIDKAYKVFIGMQQRSTISWTSMITGFAKQGHAEEALGVFQWMQRLGTDEGRPDGITFIGVLCACSHAGFVDQGRHFFECMNKKWGIVPRIEHYGCMVDLLSRAGFLDEAHRLVESMPMKPNDAVWGALLGGCRIHKNAELASHVAQKLDVALVRQKMVEIGVRKPAGRSWVQINGVVHDFVAGDWTHKHASSVYEMLSKITRQAKLEGYKLDISEVLLDVE
ncbi:Pentatricopeptide repeat-containing protein [Vitis vinifera]|uniref:Pentatricopeptide repeat-containing protein n=1 Tax=Vitis vinifera TaxID=29760 RepID=A0A438I142_VITVI|nr:Pentatricopeptide repeat-containing protein [Vitis vinifera]